MVDRHTANRIVDGVFYSGESGRALRATAMAMLAELPGYDWAGIYRLDGKTLVLDEFVGAPTDHTEIQVGVGVCGTAVAENRNQVIGDVRTVDNYLSCSAATRSELVVLVRDGAERVIGQIDIDGHHVDAFDRSDEIMLERIARILASRWDETDSLD